MTESQNPDDSKFWSPQSLGELDTISIKVLTLYLQHWERIIGPWFCISSQQKPNPVRIVSQDELDEKNRQFWKIIIREILECEQIDLFTLAKQLYTSANEISELLCAQNCKIPLELGCNILQLHTTLRPDLQLT